MKKILEAAAILAVLAFAAIGCSNNSSDDSGGGSATTTTSSSTADLPAEYTGSFTVGGKSYVSLSLDSDALTYTLSGIGGTETGTYASAAKSVADGVYTLTDSSGGTFTVTISGDNITFGAGSKTASGSGGSIYYAYETPVLPASSGADPFNGMTIFRTKGSDEVPKTATFSNGTATESTDFSNGRTVTEIYKYSWNTSKKKLYWYLDGVILSAEYLDWDSYSAEEKNFFTELGVAPGKTVSPKGYLPFCIATVSSLYKSGKWSRERYLSEVNKIRLEFFTTVSYTYSINSDSVILTAQPANADRITEICAGDRGDFIYTGDNEQWEIDDDDAYFSGGTESTQLHCYVIYDDGSKLEMAAYDHHQDNKPTLGYISASYTGSGTTRTVTITGVSSSAESIAGGLKDKSQPLTYEADTKTYTIKK